MTCPRLNCTTAGFCTVSFRPLQFKIKREHLKSYYLALPAWNSFSHRKSICNYGKTLQNVITWAQISNVSCHSLSHPISVRMQACKVHMYGPSMNKNKVSNLCRRNSCILYFPCEKLNINLSCRILWRYISLHASFISSGIIEIFYNVLSAVNNNADMWDKSWARLQLFISSVFIRVYSMHWSF